MKLKREFLSVAAALCAAAAFGVEGERTVFAHYMACFTPDVNTGRKEMSIARLYGIDGWALNCGEWQRRRLQRPAERVFHVRCCCHDSSFLVFSCRVVYGFSRPCQIRRAALQSHRLTWRR